jgi:hypothetical protein
MPSSRASRRANSPPLVVADLFDLSIQRQVQHLGHEAGADALDLVRPGLSGAGALLREHRAGRGLDRHRGIALPLVFLR